MTSRAVPPRLAGRADRRFGEAWSPAQRLKNHVIRRVVRALLFAVDRIPQRLLVALGSALGRVARVLLPGAAATARERAGACVPPASAADVAAACFENAGKSLARCALLRRADVRAADYVLLREASRAVLSRALSPRRGAIVISAHLGPFEMIPARLVEAGFAPAIVVRESYDPGLDRAVDAHRRGRGVEVIHRGHPGAALRILRALRQGRPVGVLPDLGGRGLATLPVYFLGRTVAFPIGALELAQRAHCPLVLGTLAAEANREAAFELIFEEIDASGSLDELTRRVATALSRAILRSSAEWLWMAAPHLAIADDPRSSLFSPVIPPFESGRA